LKEGKAEKGAGGRRGSTGLAVVSDSITSDSQDNSGNSFVLILPFLHNLPTEPSHIGGCFPELVFVGFVNGFDGRLQASVEELFSDILDIV